MTLNDLIIFTIALTLTQEPYENIEHIISICVSFVNMLEDSKLYSAYSLLNFESAFLKLL